MLVALVQGKFDFGIPSFGFTSVAGLGKVLVKSFTRLIFLVVGLSLFVYFGPTPIL